ncbi:MAG TPA: beta-propeller fold lactonase family protein [Solirubrobacteraceae bacterium]|nr:beta-propeller fold lactonase family protein [Solirubrobacteraceae bacterium]
MRCNLIKRPSRGPALLTIGLMAVIVLAAPASASAAPKGLFVGDYGGTSISQFTIATSGLLAPNGSVGSGAGNWMLVATPDGRYVYGTNFYSGNVSQYSVGAGGSSLAPLTPATVATGSSTDSEPEQLAVSPDGKNVYVANATSGSVSVFDVGSGGTLSLAQTVTTDLSGPTGVAVSPDGTSVYVADSGDTEIVEFNRASDGTLTAKSSPTVPTQTTGNYVLVLTPNGQYLYISGDGNATIRAFSVGSGGELTALTNTATEGFGNHQLTVSPNGRNLYASSCESDDVYQYGIGSTGALSALVPPTATTGGICPEEQWMTASGAHLYATDFYTETPSSHGDVSQFSVSSTGALSLMSPPTAPAGAGPSGVVIAPDQGPVARFSEKLGSAGKPTKFNASMSFAPDGTVVSYHWQFGDGHTLTTTTARVKHTYKKAGKYTVSLTVTDDAGCSTTLVFTGQTAYCHPGESVKHTLKVSSGAKLKLAVTPHTATAGKTTCYAFRVSSKGKPVRKSTVTLNGHHAATNSAGKTTLCLKLSKGRHRARATKKGFTAATAAIRVTAAAAFTG